jgi:DedD protein
MKLRHESKLKDKMEFQLDTRHVFYLVLWSVLLSGAIFATGLFIGQKKEEGKAGYKVTSSLAFKGLQQKEAGLGADPLVASFSFLSHLDRHPEKKELDDAVLNALAKMRLEVRERIQRQDEDLKKELAEKYFPSEDAVSEAEWAAHHAQPGMMLAQSQGVQALPQQHEARSGQAPDDLGKEDPAPKPAPYANVELKQVVTAEAAPVPVAKPEPPVVQADSQAPGEGAFAIQCKAFRNSQDAKVFIGYLKGEMRHSKYKPFIMPVELPGKGKWFRVRIGKFGSRLEAEKYKENFEKRLGLETFLVTL